MRSFRTISSILLASGLFYLCNRVAAQSQSLLNQSFENPYRLNSAFPNWKRTSRLTANYTFSTGSAISEGNLSYTSFSSVLGGSTGFMATYVNDPLKGSTVANVNVDYGYLLIIKDQARDYWCVSAGTGLGARYLKAQNMPHYFNLTLSPGVVVYTPKYYAGAGYSDLQLINKIPETYLPNGQTETFNAFLGCWLPIDNWKRVPERFLSPNFQYVSSSGQKTFAFGAYYAWRWIMPGLFYIISNKGTPDIKISAGLSKDDWRLHLATSFPDRNISSQNLAVELGIVKLFYIYSHGHSRWRRLEIQCPATW